MDFRFTVEEEAVRQQVRQYLKKHPPASFTIDHDDEGYGYGPWSNDFARAMGQQGWISMTWPKEDGGNGRPLMELLVVLEELAYAQAPTSALFLTLPLGMTIAEYGNEELKKEFLPGIASGDNTSWMGLSEPQAGSDLLALETRAVEDGDSYIINGQKVWSTGASLARYCYLLARTDPSLPRHRGLSMFIVDKNLPGVSVRPTMSLAGIEVHNECFFDNVRVPKHMMVGEKNQGFVLMLKTLEVDRFWGRFIKPPFCKSVLEMLVSYAKETRRDGKLLAKNPLVRHKLAESAVEIEACRMLFYHAGWRMSEGRALSYEATMGKMLADDVGIRLFNKGMQIMGPFAVVGEKSEWAPFRAQLQKWYLLSTGHGLAGGSPEVLRGTLATIGLGLPRG